MLHEFSNFKSVVTFWCRPVVIPVGLLHKVGASKSLERSTAKNTNLPLHSAAMFWNDAQGSSAKSTNDACLLKSDFLLMLLPCTKLRFDEFSSNGLPEN